jgi:hypothetical protein
LSPSQSLPKKVKRSKTASKVATRLAKMAEAKSYCYDYNAQKYTISKRWLHINTDSANSGKSGFMISNYYKNESFDCPNLLRISDVNSRNQYFVAYRNFSSYNGPSKKDNNAFTMRQLMIYLKNSAMVFNIDKNVFSSDHINSSEATTMVNNLDSNKLSYLTNFRKYRNEMIDKRARAESLQSTQSKNINSRQALQTEINNKQLEITQTQSDLKNLKAQAEALRQQIINYEKAINVKKTDVMDPAQQKLKETIQNFNALVAQREDNLKKINGIVPIDSDDLAQSTTSLKAKLSTLQSTYIESDPKSAEFSTLIAHLDTQMDTIPTVIA